jgi:hypothetical protein
MPMSRIKKALQRQEHGSENLMICSNTVGVRGQRLLVSRRIRPSESSGKASQISILKWFQRDSC